MTAQEIVEKWEKAMDRLRENRPEDRSWRERVRAALEEYLLKYPLLPPPRSKQ